MLITNNVFFHTLHVIINIWDKTPQHQFTIEKN